MVTKFTYTFISRFGQHVRSQLFHNNQIELNSHCKAWFTLPSEQVSACRYQKRTHTCEYTDTRLKLYQSDITYMTLL